MNIVTKRIVGFGIDVILTALIGVVVGLILVDTSILTNNVGGIITLIVFLSRDLYRKNGSPGKKIMKIKLIVKNGNKLCRVLRNITTLLWPIEGVVLLISKKRLGDMLFRTDVVDND